MADVNRCFLAVFPPPNFQQQVSDRFAALRQKETGIKWVDTHNLHMTLFFLGDLTTSTQNQLSALLQKINFAPFSYLFDMNIQSFPAGKKARVLWLWAQTRPPGGFQNMHAAILPLINKLQIETERKPFTPHLTLARVRRDYTISSQFWHMAQALPAFESKTFVCNDIVLMRSQLTAKGPRYTEIQRFSATGGRQ